MNPSRSPSDRFLAPVLLALILVMLGVAGYAVAAGSGSTSAETSAMAGDVAEVPAHPATTLLVLPAVRANSIAVDTLFLGGYASGSFAHALQVLASDLTPGERTMIGRHLDNMFENVLRANGLGGTGRLRVAYERAARPDGSTRAIRVLAAEAAVGGRVYTAFFSEAAGQPGYYDNLGRSLQSRGWTPPLEVARVTSPFNTRRMHPILRRVLPHNGIDYAATSGTQVRATGDGSISIAERRGGYGNVVEVQHPNGYATRYAHLSRIASGTFRGGVVRQGDVIGYVGMTGLATGPHLHYEVRRRGQPIDPLAVEPAQDGPRRDISPTRTWQGDRGRLARLLARAPTLLSARVSRSPASALR